MLVCLLEKRRLFTAVSAIFLFFNKNDLVSSEAAASLLGVKFTKLAHTSLAFGPRPPATYTSFSLFGGVPSSCSSPGRSNPTALGTGIGLGVVCAGRVVTGCRGLIEGGHMVSGGISTKQGAPSARACFFQGLLVLVLPSLARRSAHQPRPCCYPAGS